MPALRRAAGLVTASGHDSHSRLAAVELGLPAVVAVGDDIDRIPDGVEVVLDAKRGVVYARPASLLRRRR
jgi:phosphohistidine swiveling domain-containing protein